MAWVQNNTNTDTIQIQHLCSSAYGALQICLLNIYIQYYGKWLLKCGYGTFYSTIKHARDKFPRKVWTSDLHCTLICWQNKPYQRLQDHKEMPQQMNFMFTEAIKIDINKCQRKRSVTDQLAVQVWRSGPGLAGIHECVSWCSGLPTDSLYRNSLILSTSSKHTHTTAAATEYWLHSSHAQHLNVTLHQ